MPDLLERLTQALTGRYAVESEIGRGGMATVFLAVLVGGILFFLSAGFEK